MRKFASACSLSAAFVTAFATLSLAQAPNKPVQIFETVVSGMPSAAEQQVRVLTATMQPGEKSVRHTHAFPVTLYVVEGALTLNIEGKAPIVAKAGEAVIEMPGMKTVAENASAKDVTKVVMFYASQPDTPFLVPVGTQ